MFLTDSGKTIDVNPLQPSNALLPMFMTELGMLTDVKPMQPLNDALSILITENVLPAVTVFGIKTSPEY